MTTPFPKLTLALLASLLMAIDATPVCITISDSNYNSVFLLQSSADSTQPLPQPKPYVPYIAEAKEWVRYGELYYTLEASGVNYFVSRSYFDGDTTIDNRSYVGLYLEYGNPYPVSASLQYYLYEDTLSQMVFLYNPFYDIKDTLYDFSLVVGDVHNIYGFNTFKTTATVEAVDTIELFGNRLKRIQFDNSKTWLEGIGCISEGCYPFDNIICVKQAENLLYLAPEFNSCDTVFPFNPWRGIDGAARPTVTASVYPNPITASSVMDLIQSENQNLKIQVFSSMGKLCLEDYFYNPYPIGRTGLTRGMYFYRIVGGRKVIAWGQFLVGS